VIEKSFLNFLKEKKYLKYLLLFLINFTINTNVFAQRGPQSKDSDSSFSDIFPLVPGYFDTQVAPKNKFTFDMPLMGLFYGITDDLTIGTNSVGVLTSLFSLQPALSFTIRYRFYSSKKISATVTGYTGLMSFPTVSQDLGIWARFGNATLNFAYLLNKNNLLYFNMTAMTFCFQRGSARDTNFSKMDITAKGGGLGYSHFFTDSFGIEMQSLVLPFFQYQNEDVTQIVSFRVSQNKRTQYPFFVGVFGNYKTGPQSVLSFGLWNLDGLTTQSWSVTAPWLGWHVVL